MNIRPQDLGPKWQIALLQWRLSLVREAYPKIQESQPVYPDIGVLGRWWTNNLGLSSEAAKATLAALKRRGSAVYASLTAAVIAVITASGADYVLHQEGLFAGIMTAVAGLSLTGIFLAYPAAEARHSVKIVTEAEIQAFKDLALDPLERSYFGLVQEAQKQTLPPEADSGLRGAMQALGQALSQLPPCSPVPDMVTLTETAAQKQTEADREADVVVAASLTRQAAALRRSADIAERAARLLRRTLALRDELSAQIESLRLGLTGFQSSSGDMSGLTDLAEAVQTVAVQAASIADARSELDTALEGKTFLTANTPSAPQMLRLGGS